MPEKETTAQIKKVSIGALHNIDRPAIADAQTNGIFQLNVKNGEGKEATWV